MNKEQEQDPPCYEYHLEDKVLLFAERFGVSPDEALVLPDLFERAAKIGGMRVETMVIDATHNSRGEYELGKYIAQTAKSITKTLRDKRKENEGE